MFPEKLHKKLKNRIETDSLRSLSRANTLIDFSSNDYLGLASSESIFNEAHQFLIESNFIKNGVSGSRLLTGNHQLNTIVEKHLKDFHKSETLLFNSGYDANIGFFSAVPQRNDIILYDEFSHASIRDGIKLSNAKAYSFAHNDLLDLEEKLARFKNAEELYIITESVFSMDGDSPDLKRLIELSKKYNANVIVDEAHALGVFGFGIIQNLGLQNEVFARIITFGKSLGCHGAAILGNALLKSYLINFSRSFIYTTGLSPHSLATILNAYKFMQTNSSLQKKLVQNINYFKEKSIDLGLNNIFTESNSAIHCCIISGNSNVKKCAKSLQDNGFDVRPILSPTVPSGKERLRFCIHTYNTVQEIDKVLKMLSTFVNNLT
jgi:8-amino-7-oxononanoate synthase